MERLQKILAAAGLGSRRDCEQLILQGRVTVNGHVVKTLGAKADINTQKIVCDGEQIKKQKKVHYLFYKPREVLCTNEEKQNQPVVIDYFKNISYRLFCVGRLDKDSEGLILVTNDGEMAQRFLHPKYQIDRVYRAILKGFLTREKLQKLSRGVWLKEGKMVPGKLRLIKAKEDISIVEITLREGKNREVRRIFAKLGHSVKKLVRIQIGALTIGDLKPGMYRSLAPSEIDTFFRPLRKKRKSLNTPGR